MIDGPCRAPSSPPETPTPRKCKPMLRRARHLRVVSECSELPPSMIISPFSRSGANSPMTESIGGPAIHVDYENVNKFWSGYCHRGRHS